jgi:YVTN family beta-propeller protein
MTTSIVLKALLVAVTALAGTAAQAADEPLTVSAKIPLGRVTGRIDHLVIDTKRNRLFVAELGNNSIGVIDLTTQKVVKRITGLREPQGIAYEPRTDRVYIANAGDGVVKTLAAETLSPIGEVKLGEDADNIRLGGPDRIFVGYGNGAIAVLQAGKKVADLPLDAHPESFQIDAEHGRLFVNQPEAHGIAVIDDKTGQQQAQWGVRGLNGNFSMAFDAANHRLFVAYRSPATLAIFDTTTGDLLSRLPICGDADDVFFDAKRNQLYISCGEGFVTVVSAANQRVKEIGRVRTRTGARTSLFVPELDRLFVAVRANAGEPAEVWVLLPQS